MDQTQNGTDLENALSYLDGMFANSADAVIAFDRELRLMRWNRVAENLTQITSSAALNATPLSLFPALHGHEESACFDQALKGRCTSTVLSLWSGSRTYYGPLLGLDGSVVGGYAVAKVASEMQSNLERLQRSNAELERFAYVAAHDLQEPVRMVASYARLLSDKLAASLDDGTRRYLEFALDGALRMRAVIDGLLAVSRVKAIDEDCKDIVSVHDVVVDALSLLALAVEESAAQITILSLPSLCAQRVLLVQLFQNLIGNAIKFRSADPPRIEIGCEQTKPGEWLFYVQDNGIGMPMEHAERAFHLLQRVHSRKRYPGSGLGLTLCQAVVERHGGRIWLTSSVGTGTRVLFTLTEGRAGA